MKNRELFQRDPVVSKLLNDGVAAVSEAASDKEIETLRYELEHFVCEGQYEGRFHPHPGVVPWQCQLHDAAGGMGERVLRQWQVTFAEDVSPPMGQHHLQRPCHGPRSCPPSAGGARPVARARHDRQA